MHTFRMMLPLLAVASVAGAAFLDEECPSYPSNETCTIEAGAVNCLVETTCGTAAPPSAADFDLLALVHAKLGDIQGCKPANVGVNCVRPTNDKNGPCGVIIHDAADYHEGTTLVGAKTRFRPKPKTDKTFVGRLLSNEIPLADLSINTNNGDEENVCIVGEDFRRTWAPPIIGDIDLVVDEEVVGDGNDSCSVCGEEDEDCVDGCKLDYGDVGALCGMHQNGDGWSVCDFADTPSLPGMTGGNVTDTQTILSGSTVPLAPYTRYAHVVVQKNATLELAAGRYQICKLDVAKNSTVTIPDSGEVELHVGSFNVGKAAQFGIPESGDVLAGCIEDPAENDAVRLMVFGYGSEDVGRFNVSGGVGGNVRGFFCAPERTMHIGDQGTFVGRVVAREILSGGRIQFVPCKP